jgi:hypothetical protein
MLPALIALALANLGPTTIPAAASPVRWLDGEGTPIAQVVSGVLTSPGKDACDWSSRGAWRAIDALGRALGELHSTKRQSQEARCPSIETGEHTALVVSGPAVLHRTQTWIPDGTVRAHWSRTLGKLNDATFFIAKGRRWAATWRGAIVEYAGGRWHVVSQVHPRGHDASSIAVDLDGDGVSEVITNQAADDGRVDVGETFDQPIVLRFNGRSWEIAARGPRVPFEI